MHYFHDQVLQDKPLDQLRGMTANIAFNEFIFAEPIAPRVTKSKLRGADFNFTPWSRIDIEDPNISLAGLIKYMEDKYGLLLSMLSSGVTILYSDFMPKKKMEERMKMKIFDIVETVTKKKILPAKKYLVLELIVSDCETDTEVEIPYVRFKLH